MSADQKILIDLIKKNNLSLLANNFTDLNAISKAALVDWLKGRGFPSDNPTDLVGDTYVEAWFSDNSKLLIFGLNYEEEEQCGGTIIFSLTDDACKYVTDNVECSS